ncbi:MAG TPA: hypothetical protein VLR45_03930, partial [Desulfoprunum sp.]|nr:hypothetical protein [Desulfoprunum sp.]
NVPTLCRDRPGRRNDTGRRDLDAISVAERHHEQIFRELAENIDTGRIFSRPEETVWKCLGCGYLHPGTEPPAKCPACVRPRGYFEMLGKNW